MALVVRIPESAGVAWNVQPAPSLALENGSRASIVVLESSWHLAMGRSVTSTAHLDAASEEAHSAALIRLQKVGSPADSALAKSSDAFAPAALPVFSFLPRQMPTHVNLLTNINPRLGRHTQLDGLLVLHPDAPASQPQVVFITVTAL